MLGSSNLCLATPIPEIGYILLPSRDMTEILLTLRNILETTKQTKRYRE